MWDLGGQANLRPSWATYYRATDAVIVVIDSTDRARASIAKVCEDLLLLLPVGLLAPDRARATICCGARSKYPSAARLRCSLPVLVGILRGLLVILLQAELFTLLEHEHLQEAAILIMANKQDLKDAMNVKEMTDLLSLHSLKRHDWHIQVKFSFVKRF